MHISIRSMTKEDCQSFLALDSRVFPDDEIPWDKHAFNYFFRPDLCFAAYEKETNEMLGYVFAEYREEENKILISNLGVAPENQRRYIGTKLMETVIRTAQSLYLYSDILTLQVKKDNVKAKALYQKFDFEPIGDSKTQPGYEEMFRILHQELKEDVSAQTERLDGTIKYKHTFQNNLGLFANKNPGTIADVTACEEQTSFDHYIAQSVSK